MTAIHGASSIVHCKLVHTFHMFLLLFISHHLEFCSDLKGTEFHLVNDFIFGDLITMSVLL